jgi:hypothetical protein
MWKDITKKRYDIKGDVIVGVNQWGLEYRSVVDSYEYNNKLHRKLKTWNLFYFIT